ncbi:MAG: bifunctional ornithine acetyltransferase/N-acetylglutamate synthase [Acetobacteraceae bacterium]
MPCRLRSPPVAANVRRRAGHRKRRSQKSDARALFVGTKCWTGTPGAQPRRAGSVVAGYDEAPVVRHMQGREISIAVDLGLGQGSARVFTCDLTHASIDISGSYRS